MNLLNGFSRHSVLAAAVVAGLGFTTANFANAAAIVSEDFTASSHAGGNLIGTAPDLANAPGGTWGEVAGFTWGQPYINGSNQANTSVNGTGFATSIMTAGSYTKPTQFTIQADLQPTFNVPQGGYNTLALGFYSSNITLDTTQGGGTVVGSDFQYFTGLSLDSSGGLSLVVDGRQVGSTIPFGGTYVYNTGLNTLSYNVNTTTGAISDIALSGSTADYSALDSTMAFTDAATEYAGVGANGTQNQNGALVDNFSVTATPVPEPASLSLLGLGSVALLRRRRSRA